MADLMTALKARLQADGPVADLVATKIHWGIVPQGTVLPYIRLQVISDPRPQTLKAYDGARVTRVQADCFADRYATGRAMAEAVIVALAAPTEAGGVRFGRTKAEGPRDLGEDIPGTGYIHRASLDLLVEHTMA